MKGQSQYVQYLVHTAHSGPLFWGVLTTSDSTWPSRRRISRCARVPFRHYVLRSSTVAIALLLARQVGLVDGKHVCHRGLIVASLKIAERTIPPVYRLAHRLGELQAGLKTVNFCQGRYAVAIGTVD